MDFRKRLDTFRQRMDDAGVDLAYIMNGSNLFYLTGMPRKFEHGAEHNAWGDWAIGAYIGRGGVVFLGPRMGGAFYQTGAEGKPWIDNVRLIQESESPLEVMRQTIGEVAGEVRHIAVDNRAWAETTQAFRELAPTATTTLVSELVMPMRIIKEDDEIEAMRRASQVADLVFERVVPRIKIGVTDLELVREVEYQFAAAGAEYTSFQTAVYIIGPDGDSKKQGPARVFSPGDSLMFDFGGVVGGYCSDFGRCAFAGEPPEEYRRIHNLILESQRTGIEMMKSGQVTASEVNAAARKVLADAGYDQYFTHRLGHGMGVALHERPTLDVVDNTVLQTNMVFTVEPSIRIPGRMGNRVEDVVVVKPGGGEVLNKATHELVVVE